MQKQKHQGLQIQLTQVIPYESPRLTEEIILSAFCHEKVKRPDSLICEMENPAPADAVQTKTVVGINGKPYK